MVSEPLAPQAARRHHRTKLNHSSLQPIIAALARLTAKLRPGALRILALRGGLPRRGQAGNESCLRCHRPRSQHTIRRQTAPSGNVCFTASSPASSQSAQSLRPHRIRRRFSKGREAGPAWRSIIDAFPPVHSAAFALVRLPASCKSTPAAACSSISGALNTRDGCTVPPPQVVRSGAGWPPRI